MMPRFPEGRTLSLSGKRALASGAAMLLALAGAALPARAQAEQGMSRLAVAVAGATQAMEPGEAGDWVFACDNRAWCTLIGHDGLANPNRVVASDSRSLALRLWIDPQGRVARLEFVPDLQVTTDESDRIDWLVPFPLTIPNLRGRPVAMPFARGELGGTDIAAVVNFLRRGRALEGQDPATGRTRLRLPWVGFADAMSQIRRRQQAVQRWLRVARPDLSEVRLRPLVPVMVSGVPPVTADQMDWCGNGIDAADLAAFDMGPSGQLWQHSCAGDARNERLVRYFTVAPGQEAHVLRLPGELGATTADRGWFWPNASVEPDFGVIRSTSYSMPGRDDCGTAIVWGWTGHDWVVLEQRMLPLCNGLAASDWIVTWRRQSVSARQ